MKYYGRPSAHVHTFLFFFFFFNDTATTEIYTLSLHDALPILNRVLRRHDPEKNRPMKANQSRSEEHTSELQSLTNLVCRLLLEKKKNKQIDEARRRQPRHARHGAYTAANVTTVPGLACSSWFSGCAPLPCFFLFFFFFLIIRRPPNSPLFPSPPLSR